MPIDTYTVLAEHPNGRTKLDVQLIASSERAAISRTRGTLVHRDRDMAWLQGEFTIIDRQPGVWPGDTREHTRGRA